MMSFITGEQPTQADAMLYPLTLTAQRAVDMSATQPYLDVGYSMVVLKNPEATSPFIFANPFTPYAWLAILCALVATVVALILTDGFTRHARLRAIERVHGYRRAKKLHRKERAAEYALEATFMVLGAGSAPTSPSWSTRLVFIGWAIVAIVLLATYTANLTANLTVAQLATPFKTLEEMSRDSEVRFGVVVSGSIEAYFRTSSDRVARSLVDRMELYANNAEAVAAVRDRGTPVSAAMLDFPVAVWWASQPPCDLAIGSDTFGPGALVIAFPKGSPLQEPISASLLRLTDDGTVAELRRQWLSTAACGGGGGDTEGAVAEAQSSLGVESIWGIFFVLAIIVAIAAVYACGEVLFYSRLYKGQVEILPRSPTVTRLRSFLTGTPASLTRSGSGGGGGGGGSDGGAAASGGSEKRGGKGGGGGLLSSDDGTELGYVRDGSFSRSELRMMSTPASSGRRQMQMQLQQQYGSGGGGGVGAGGSGGGSGAAAAGVAAAGLSAAAGGQTRRGTATSGAGLAPGGSRTPSVRFSLGPGSSIGGEQAALSGRGTSAGGAGAGAAAAASPFAAPQVNGMNAAPDEFFDETSSSDGSDSMDTATTGSTSDDTSSSEFFADARGGGGGVGGGGGGGGGENDDPEDPFARRRRGGGGGGGGLGRDESQEERGVRSLLRRLRG
jgi:ABC-type amino acid transport substrate-binding protein